jgi:hypothetical protein
MSSPTSRSLEHCRKLGQLPEVVEKYNAFTRRKADYLGFVDILSISPAGIYGIQTTSGSNLSARYKKVTIERRDNAIAFLNAGGRILLHGWSKRKVKRGGVAMRWHLTEREVTLEDFKEKE